ncbi:hypothetical protein KDM41_08135, partial [bacterium]|nr:hypothetical protein [bacterium]
MFRRSWVQAVTGLLEFVYPERCVLCEASPADVAWWPGACAGPGCRAADRPHLCAACAAALAPQVV